MHLHAHTCTNLRTHACARTHTHTHAHTLVIHINAVCSYIRKTGKIALSASPFLMFTLNLWCDQPSFLNWLDKQAHCVLLYYLCVFSLCGWVGVGVLFSVSILLQPSCFEAQFCLFYLFVYSPVRKITVLITLIFLESKEMFM